MYSQQDIVSVVKTILPKLTFNFPYSPEKWVNEMNMCVENYHKHTAWSNFIMPDSVTSIENFINFSKENGGQLYFSGEHGFPGEWLYCYKLCKEMDIRFRYSMEAYWVKDNQQKDNTNCHIVIIARTYNAIRKLNYICSEAHENGYYYKPRIDLKLLFTLNKDEVYVTSACIAGWKYEDSTELWLSVWQHFGDSFFLEYQANNTPEQKAINQRIYEMHKQFGIQTIIGLDTHYLNDAEKVQRDNLLLRKKINYPEEQGWYMDFPSGTTLYNRMLDQDVIPPEEIVYSMLNTFIFIDNCDDLTYNTDFKIPILSGYKNLSYDQRAAELYKILIDSYSKEEIRSPERQAGIDYEFQQIKESQSVDYFLDNYFLVHSAVNDFGGQLTPTSRGSASSYYTSKLLGFTTMDRFECEVPIYPERFITKERVLDSHQLPDIDYNVSSQQPFVSAARKLFGDYSCYPLLAVGTLAEKNGFKLYASVQGLDPQIANDITKQIDSFNEAVKNAEDDEKENIHIEDYIKDKKHLQIFYDSKPYQGIIEQAKCHACGFMLFNGVLTQKDVSGYGDIKYEIGLIRCVSKSGKTSVVCNIEGGLLDYFGYVKDDFLIVDVVTIIYKLYNALNMPIPTTRQLRQMVSNDPDTWQLYAIGATQGLNQVERKSTTEKAKRYKPKNIKELAAFIAGIRPGFKSLLDGFLKRIKYTNGEPMIDELLEDCFHYMLYQEAVMKIFSYLGIPMKDSYDTIKKISKKKLKGEALKKVEDTLRQHWLDKISNLNNFDRVYQVIKDSARYSFNAPHALAMANDSLYVAWVKAHHTSVFYEVELNHYQSKDNKDKVAELLNEAVNFFGYKIEDYVYGTDTTKFTVDDATKSIYPNLSSIKGIGTAAALAVYETSKSNLTTFEDVYCSLVKAINKTNFLKLVYIGYFKQYGNIHTLVSKIANIEKYWGKNTAKKADLPQDLPFQAYCFINDVIKSGHSKTQYKILDDIEFIKCLNSTVSEEEYPQTYLAALAYNVLGYLNRKYNVDSKNLVMVTELNDSYSPNFKAICLKTNAVCEMKIYKSIPAKNFTVKTAFKTTPIQDGMVIKLNRWEKRPKKQKVNNEWRIVPNAFEWWITDYEIVENINKKG